MEATEAPKVDGKQEQAKKMHRMYQKKYRETKMSRKVKPSCPTCGYALQKVFLNSPSGRTFHPNQMYCKICDKIVQI
jgi:lipopolysaccharide biosynthesis regulator YciM